jgi:hypothetical protein
MGYSRAQKANTHECIIKLASKRFREEGLAGIGIAELMKEAGDIARSGKRTRAVITRQIRADIELVGTMIRDTNEKGKGTARSQAILTYCALVGAIGVLARYRTSTFRAKS